MFGAGVVEGDLKLVEYPVQTLWPQDATTLIEHARPYTEILTGQAPTTLALPPSTSAYADLRENFYHRLDETTLQSLCANTGAAFGGVESGQVLPPPHWQVAFVNAQIPQTASVIAHQRTAAGNEIVFSSQLAWAILMQAAEKWHESAEINCTATSFLIELNRSECDH